MGSFDTRAFASGLHLDAWVELLRERVLEACAAGGVARVEPGNYEMARANLSAGTPTTWPVSLARGGSSGVYQCDLDPETRRSASDVPLAKLTYWWQQRALARGCDR